MMSETKKITSFIILCLAAVTGYLAFSTYNKTEELKRDQPPVTPSYKNISYLIDGQSVELNDGYSESLISPGSAAKVTTRYFGNELFTDLDGDGDDDVAFILTQETGGSGTFYYAVAAINTENGYLGSDGYLLGDLIAPQSTNVSQNPRHKNVVVFNYAIRAEGEPMTTQPSVGKSVYLKIVPETIEWGIVEPDFEGESAL
jgi:hypothetical protein